MKITLEENEAVQIVPIEYRRDADPINVIREMVTQDELLAQLEEEAAELAQAALKVRRTLSNSNPTPVKRHEAEKLLLEEIADVNPCLHVCDYEKVRDKIEVNRIISSKADRWVKRLYEAGE